VKDLWVWRYELLPKRALNALSAGVPRHGALVRAGSGVADIHPWPELGDAPLDEQLELLARGETTPLTRQTLELARADGEAREAGRSLFEGLTVPPSHWPFAGGAVPRAFDTVKVKMGPDPEWESIRTLAGYRLRLDFNGTLNARELTAFVNTLPPDIRESIDFIEDPSPYDAAEWQALRDRLNVRLALDRGVEEEGVDVLVVKPAVQPFPVSDKEIVVTSYMDHPVGQLGAAWVAAKTVASSTCGLLTHTLFEKDPFLERMTIEGTRLVPPGGTGVGFDDLLEALPWKRLG
jgi:O-succinylbenzoate synthase